MTNLLAAINVNQVEQFLDNWRFNTDADGNRTGRKATDFAPFRATPDSVEIDVYNPRHCSVAPEFQGYWKERAQGPNNFQLVNIYVADIQELDWTDPADPDPKMILTVVHYLREAFSGGLKVLDVFKRDGVRHGQSVDLVENGTTMVDEYETVTVLVDTQVLNVEETIAQGQPVYDTVPIEEQVRQPTGQQIEVPNYDEVITGQPTYPPVNKNEMLKYMPDDDGGAPAVDYKGVHTTLGYAPRRYE